MSAILSKISTFKAASPSERKEKIGKLLSVLYRESCAYFFSIFGIIFVLTAKPLSPWVYLRIAKWKSNRIGHEVADMDAFL